MSGAKPYGAAGFAGQTSGMTRLYASLHQWLRKTTSSFAQLYDESQDTVVDDSAQHRGLIYKLREWPALPEDWSTAPVFRALSVMSQRHVNRHWLITRQGLAPSQADDLIRYLVHLDAVDIVDASDFAPASR